MSQNEILEAETTVFDNEEYKMFDSIVYSFEANIVEIQHILYNIISTIKVSNEAENIWKEICRIVYEYGVYYGIYENLPDWEDNNLDVKLSNNVLSNLVEYTNVLPEILEANIKKFCTLIELEYGKSKVKKQKDKMLDYIEKCKDLIFYIDVTIQFQQIYGNNKGENNE